MFEFILNFLKFSSYSQPELASYLQDLPSAYRLYMDVVAVAPPIGL